VVTLYLARSRQVVRLGLEDYLAGVVAAEMPARFSLEALKAQAVAARTLAVRRLRCFGGRGCRHYARADICDQPGDGQAWLSEAALKRNWGWSYNRLRGQINCAVMDTKGLVLLYDHRPIDAAYHSTCGGATEDAAEVWHQSIPYLTSVTCGFDRFSPRFSTRVRFSQNEVVRRLGFGQRSAGKQDGAVLDPHILGRNASGRVTKVLAAGKVFTGSAFRTALGLRSTNFSWEVQGRDLVFTVIGYGHGVGLCQYGAEGMARKGASYLQILHHYYHGVTLGRIRE